MSMEGQTAGGQMDERLITISPDLVGLGIKNELTLNAPISTKVVCLFRLLKCLRSLCGKQCGPRSDCSYRFASILNLSVMLGNFLQQTT